tara:strand:- start:929 stop:1231 length:303 start_codon:yes stop_codon:yes gene_type:complete
MEERKEWRTLYMINKPVVFLGFLPMQWLFISCILFLIGYAVWWLAIMLIPIVYLIGRRLSKEHSNGNPGYISSLIVRRSMPKYFEDRTGLFDQPIIDAAH